MSQSKFTPGPWKTSGVNPHRIIAVEGRSVGLEICATKGFLAEYREQSLANAQLIAAAPDLLAALKHLVHWHDQLSPADIAKAESVIAKAEGQQ
jgi:hypothetical protein